jgi:hypothetical protein
MSEAPRVGVGVLVTKDDRRLLLKRRNVHGAGSLSTASFSSLCKTCWMDAVIVRRQAISVIR